MGRGGNSIVFLLFMGVVRQVILGSFYLHLQYI